MASDAQLMNNSKNTAVSEAVLVIVLEKIIHQFLLVL